MNRIVRGLLVMGCVLLIGCRREAARVTPEDEKRIAEVRELIAKACGCERDPKPMKASLRMFKEFVATTNATERKKLMMIVRDAMSNTKLSGSNRSERQVSYAHLHYFRQKASEILGLQNDFYWQLELWFAEVECFKMETAFCEEMVKKKKEFLNQNPTLVFGKAGSELCEWENMVRQSQGWYEDDMSLIVLWDDSVAAKYCATLSWWEKMKVVWRIKKVIGRYPDWYLEDKGGQGDARKKK